MNWSGGLWLDTGDELHARPVQGLRGRLQPRRLHRPRPGDPAGSDRVNFVPLLSNGSSFTSGGLWYDTGSSYSLDQSKVFAGDFNRDGYTDLGLVTPRGASGLNVVPLLSDGTKFVSGGLWLDTGMNYTLDQSKVFAGDFNRDGYTDLGLVTPRGATWLELRATAVEWQLVHEWWALV